MDFPLWIFFALVCAIASAGVLIFPERLKCDGFALAFWNKVTAFVLMVPLVIYTGLPYQWEFYALVATQAMLWVISDVIFFRALPEVGAGVVSRLLPMTVVITFVLWFLFDHELLKTYLDSPEQSILVLGTLCLFVYFAMRLKKDPITWSAVRRIWFVLFAAVIGPLMYKMVTQHTNIEQGPFAFVMFESLVMVTAWSVFYVVKNPIPKTVLFSHAALKAGAIVGTVMCVMSLSKFAAMHYVDNPGLVPAIKYLDAVFIMAYYRIIHKTEKADVAAGLGIVACAVAIVVLKSMNFSS